MFKVSCRQPFVYLFYTCFTSISIYSALENHHMFRVLCLGLGDQELSVSVGNKASSKNKFPATSTANSR